MHKQDKQAARHCGSSNCKPPWHGSIYAGSVSAASYTCRHSTFQSSFGNLQQCYSEHVLELVNQTQM